MNIAEESSVNCVEPLKNLVSKLPSENVEVTVPSELPKIHDSIC